MPDLPLSALPPLPIEVETRLRAEYGDRADGMIEVQRRARAAMVAENPHVFDEPVGTHEEGLTLADVE